MNTSNVSRRVEKGLEIDVFVSPNSSVQGTEGTDEWRKCIVIRVHSPPSDGKANREVEELVKNITGYRSEIIRGHTNRKKTIMIFGDPDKILSSLEKWK
jgi:hypothetical protein